MSDEKCGFNLAQPIWLKGREKEVNLQAGFKCHFQAKNGGKYSLLITGSTLYRIFINGYFLHYGPARGPHGYVRIDKLDISSHVREGINTLAIEVAGYNCNTYYTLNMPSFIQAEILKDEAVIAATGDNGIFIGFPLTIRLQKVMRHSYQRNFTEVYNLNLSEPITNWILCDNVSKSKIGIVDICKKYLPRQVPVPSYKINKYDMVIGRGKINHMLQYTGEFEYLQHRFIHGISEMITGYTLDEIEERPFEVIQKLFYERYEKDEENCFPEYIPHEIGEYEYVLIDLGLNNNGFILSEIITLEDSKVYMFFDEKLLNGRIAVKSMQAVNIVMYSLARSMKPYKLETFETYGFRYLICFVLKGRIILNSLSLREYSYPNYQNTELNCEDKELSTIFKAAIETYRQNTLDVFMDCPTRERAGWLCDSYFTAQSAQYFSGESIVEKLMLENFILTDSFPGIPKGMLPMCYPAEHPSGNFIPQWAMWYVIQLDEYFIRSGYQEKVKFKNLCYNLVEYLNKFKNSDGLLERLEKWNFIEWSQANKWVQDVNYPTNMLYSRMLELIGNWYDDIFLCRQADAIRKKIVDQSFNGNFFIDNAVRLEDGSLQRTENKSEVCQYYAFFFNVADELDSKFDYLKELILNVFGPDRKNSNVMPEIAFANAFIGNYLRMELLLRWGEYAKVLKDIKEYFYPMAETTGTLWEHDSPCDSLNHGFASFTGVAIIKSLLGVKKIDNLNKIIVLDFGDIEIAASCRVGTPSGDIIVKREIVDSKPRIIYSVPEGYQCKVTL